MKKAFTLIEMMIAILLFSLIAIFLSSTLQSLHQQSSALEVKNDTLKHESRVIKLLQEDIQQSDNLEIKHSDNYISLELHTMSSIYNISHAYVRWFVHPQKKILIRSESAFKLSPPFIDEELHQIHLDPTLSDIEWFKAYKSISKDALLISLNFQNRNLILEVLTPQPTTK